LNTPSVRIAPVISAGADSVKSILFALGANFLIALAQTGGAIFTGSSSMLAEAIHSYADCANQGLLLTQQLGPAVMVAVRAKDAAGRIGAGAGRVDQPRRAGLSGRVPAGAVAVLRARRRRLSGAFASP
jgi:hypothetical protein